MRDTLVVGYCPVEGSPGDSLGVAFVHTDSGQRLARYCGLLSSRQLLDHFDLVNLFRRPDAPFDLAEGTRRAQALVAGFIEPRRYSRVLLLSSPVAQAFGRTYHPLFEWEPLPGTSAQAAVVPHPSGLVRWWNDPENVRTAQAFLRPLTD